MSSVETMEAQGEKRLEGLRESVARLKVRGGQIPIERWLMIGGAAMIVLGIPLIILGWLGAARTPYTFEQIPYLISGGLLGLALAVVGGLLYFAYWMTRQIQETRRQAEETRDALARIAELLASGGAAPAVARTRSTAATGAANGTFVATAKGTMFHRRDCAVVAGRSDVRTVKAGAPGLVPCKICDPLGAE
jgi:hypothetical protein